MVILYPGQTCGRYRLLFERLLGSLNAEPML